MKFPVVIHKDPDSDFGVTVPDLPGCFSAGDTLEDAFENAVEAIQCHIEGLLIDEEPVPSPQSMDAHYKNRAYKGGVWGLVDVDLSKLSGKAKRINVTLPERILTQVDSYAESHGLTRSGFLAQAALESMARE